MCRSLSRSVVPTALVAAVCVALAASGVEAAGTGAALPTGGVGGTPRIVNGTLTSAYPAVGALLSPADPQLAGLLCSGTLIGCQTFLTAAHCVCDFTGAACQSGPNAPNPADYVVFLQHAGFFAVSSIHVHPDFAFPVGDVAVLTLATPVTGVAPTPIDVTDAPAAGAPATIVGFGRNAGAQDYGLKRAGAVAIAPCVSGVSSTTSVCWDFTAPLGAPGTQSDTCNGDSGGPLLAGFQCGDTVAGTTSGGTSANCVPTDHSYDANVFHYREYIRAYAGADLDRAACGAMPQAGDPGTAILAASGTLDATTPQATHAIAVPAGSARVRVALNASEDLGADFDLYVKAGSVPSVADFDCKADGPNQFGFCEIAAPAAGTWYALVQRSQGSGAYQLTATTFASGTPGPGTEGQPCDDANVCTASDVCRRGACGGTPVDDGATCDDGSACTGPDVCVAGTCSAPPAPVAGCKAPVVGGKSSLLLKSDTRAARNRLAWRWVRGAATATAELGDPVRDAGYELCVFDEQGGAPTLALDALVPAGSGWSPVSRGYAYRDLGAQHAGVRTLMLRSGDAGKASITLGAKGARLRVPPLPLAQDATVTVQLLGAQACFEARYSTSRENSAATFRAFAD